MSNDLSSAQEAARKSKAEVDSVLAAADAELKRFARSAEESASSRVSTEVGRVRRDAAATIEELRIQLQSADERAEEAQALSDSLQEKAILVDAAAKRAASAEGVASALKNRVTELEAELRRGRENHQLLRTRAEDAEDRAVEAAASLAAAQSDRAATTARMQQAHADWDKERAR